MADAATAGQGAERPDPNLFDPAKAAIVPHDDGGMTIHMDGMPPAPGADPNNLAFDADLTPLFTDQELGRLGGEIVGLVDEDEQSRKDWRTTYKTGLKLMGLKYEERTEPWEGACGVFHPMLLESVIRFNAQAISDIFPAGGPVKTDIIGRITDDKERQARRVQTDMNWLLTEKVSGYRDETDMMLFNLALAGTTFRKFRFDKLRKVPAAEYVLPEHLVMPYSAASLKTADRYTVILPKTNNAIDSLMAEGFYRKVEIGRGINVQTEITQQKDKIDGRSNSNTADDALHRLYEMHLNYWFEQDTASGDQLPHPYVVTVDSVSRKVLAIRRNWRDGDAAMERQEDVVQHKYMPGFGPYGIGLINILGGMTEGATSILRQLVDAGVLSNLPAGFKTKQARIKDDSTPQAPGEWRDVEVGAATLRDSFFPLPYKEPSQVLLSLMGVIVDEGRRVGSVADMKITDMTGQNMPVGTTLAIIERSMKVMSAVQKRLYESFKNEFKIIAEIVHDFMGDDPYNFELDPRDAQKASRKVDYDDKKVSVIPVADPNASTMAQRIMVLQAIIQLTQTSPNIYDLKAVHRDMITVLGSDKADLYIPPDAEVQPADPITENMNLLTSKPVRAGIAQDHDAHITVHMAAAQDPKIIAMLQNTPAATSIVAATQAHILEHLAFKYRADIEKQLGVPLPPPDQPLPEDVEYQISRLAAAAATKLLAKDQSEEQQKQALANMQDPVLQMQARELDIKETDAETKRMKVQNEQAGAITDRQVKVLMEIFKELQQTKRATITAEAQKGMAIDENEIRLAELSAELGTGMAGHIGNLIIAKAKLDGAAEIAASRNTNGTAT